LNAGQRSSGKVRGREKTSGESLGKRVFGAIVFVIVFLGALLLGSIPFTFVVAIASVIGCIELFTMFETKGDAIPVAAVIGIAGTLAYVFCAHWKPIASFGYVTLALVVLSFSWYILILKHVKPARAIALTILVPILTGFCLSHLVLLRDLVDGSSNSKNGFWIVFFFMVIIWLYDVAAWWAGRRYGKHKMAPTISPKKSWEGAFAGTIAALGTSVLLRFIIKAIMGKEKFFPWLSVPVAIVIALIVCVLGPFGDLSESLLKREYGVKDIGAIIPGHGGIMDRFDSTIFTAPAVFYYLYYFVLKLK